MKENRNIENFIHISTDEVYGNALNKNSMKIHA